MRIARKWLIGFVGVAIAALVVLTASPAESGVSSNCTYNGVPLYGKVKFVSSSADVKVEFVSSFPDLKVEFVSSFPDKCGKWQVVDSFPDFTVEEVSSFADIKVKEVSSFPGLP